MNEAKTRQVWNGEKNVRVPIVKLDEDEHTMQVGRITIRLEGPQGCGKTRLMQQIADMLAAQEDGK